MGREYCSHCSRLIIEIGSESGPSIIRDGVKVYCNTSCYSGQSEKLKPNLNALSIAVGMLGGSRVNTIIRSTIDKVNKGKVLR
jgi:hypothetical protein